MSETSKPAEAAKKVTDQTAKFGQANMDVASKLTNNAANETKAAVNQAGEVTRLGVERAKATAENITETVAETADTATKISGRAAEQGREILLMGARTAAGVGSRVADISYGRSHHLLTSTAQAMDIYRDAAERSAGRMQALFSSYMTFGRGLQIMQHALLELADHSMRNATHKPQDIFRCKNIVELAEVQRDLYSDALNHVFEATSRLLDIAGRTAQDAVRPLQSDVH